MESKEEDDEGEVEYTHEQLLSMPYSRRMRIEKAKKEKASKRSESHTANKKIKELAVTVEKANQDAKSKTAAQGFRNEKDGPKFTHEGEDPMKTNQMWAHGCLRMQHIDIETIYPQEEKDREAAKLKALGDYQRKNITKHADGIRLIGEFVEPQRQQRLDSPVRRDQIEDSYVKSPDQYRFLKKLDRRVDKYAKTQYDWKLQKGEV